MERERERERDMERERERMMAFNADSSNANCVEGKENPRGSVITTTTTTDQRMGMKGSGMASSTLSINNSGTGSVSNSVGGNGGGGVSGGGKLAVPCRYFNSWKGCMFGDTCEFGHFLESASLALPVPLEVHPNPLAHPLSLHHMNRHGQGGGDIFPTTQMDINVPMNMNTNMGVVRHPGVFESTDQHNQSIAAWPQHRGGNRPGPTAPPDRLPLDQGQGEPGGRWLFPLGQGQDREVGQGQGTGWRGTLNKHSLESDAEGSQGYPTRDTRTALTNQFNPHNPPAPLLAHPMSALTHFQSVPPPHHPGHFLLPDMGPIHEGAPRDYARFGYYQDPSHAQHPQHSLSHIEADIHTNMDTNMNMNINMRRRGRHNDEEGNQSNQGLFESRLQQHHQLSHDEGQGHRSRSGQGQLDGSNGMFWEPTGYPQSQSQFPLHPSMVNSNQEGTFRFPSHPNPHGNPEGTSSGNTHPHGNATYTAGDHNQLGWMSQSQAQAQSVMRQEQSGNTWNQIQDIGPQRTFPVQMQNRGQGQGGPGQGFFGPLHNQY